MALSKRDAVPESCPIFVGWLLFYTGLELVVRPTTGIRVASEATLLYTELILIAC